MAQRIASLGRESMEQRLASEFEGVVDPETIALIVQEEVASFASARIRDYVPILAMRQARARLKQGSQADPDHLETEMGG